MEVRKYGNKKILIADSNKQIRDINDTYTPQMKDEGGNVVQEEYKPYYSSIIFLADNFDDSKLNELYIEEEIESEV